MENFAIIRDVGETLKTLVKDRIRELSDESQISYDSPAEIESASTTKLSIFLYQINHNIYYRNSEPEPVRRMPNPPLADEMKFPPLALDLLYLFTPYAPNRETELIILENIMVLFHDLAVLKGDRLQGKLTASGNHDIRVVPHGFSFDEINKLWERFPNKPFKLSVAYMLTPIMVPSGKEPYEIRRVLEKMVDIKKI